MGLGIFICSPVEIGTRQIVVFFLAKYFDQGVVKPKHNVDDEMARWAKI